MSLRSDTDSQSQSRISICRICLDARRANRCHPRAQSRLQAGAARAVRVGGAWRDTREQMRAVVGWRVAVVVWLALQGVQGKVKKAAGDGGGGGGGGGDSSHQRAAPSAVDRWQQNAAAWQDEAAARSCSDSCVHVRLASYSAHSTCVALAVVNACCWWFCFCRCCSAVCIRPHPSRWWPQSVLSAVCHLQRGCSAPQSLC